MDPKNMKVVKLKSILKSKGASTHGNKEILVKRVNELLESEQSKAVRDESNINVKSEFEPVVSPPPEQEKTATDEPQSVEMKEEAPASDAESAATNGTESTGVKRKNTSDGHTPKRKKVKGPPAPKTPANILNEIQPGSQYNLLSEDKKTPWFVMEVDYKGDKYLGSGPSKKDAKHSAAANALGSVVQYRQPDRVLPFVKKIDRRSMDFTSDCMEGANMVPFAEVGEDHFTPRAKPAPAPKAVKNPASSPASTKNPVQVLNELRPGLVYECTGESPVFTMAVTVNENKYEGFGKSKKNAKAGAAIKALRNEFNIIVASPEQESIPSNLGTEDAASIQISGNLPDLIFTLIRDKFNSLVGSSSADIKNYKVLAGIVMTRGSDNEGEVISLATGTKCISGEYISDQGSSLFDCHAEIVSRRGLRRYLYNQLLGVSKGEHTILEPYIDGGYKVREGINFHLYINTAPCGDSRLFAPHESAAAAEDNHPNRRSRGQLRTKIENGEGTIPVDSAALVQERGRGNVQQTWDAVISGERLLTMSCSDKIAKWNVLGVQGSLLSLYIQPVYLSTMILGSLYHCQHLQRGVFTRAQKAMDASLSVQDGPGLPHPYRVHRPALAAVPNQKKREAKKSPTYCVHWTQGDDETKVINTSTGRDYDGGSSNLCKSEMMKMLKQVVLRGGLKPRTVLPNTHQMTYAQLKALATEYQSAKYLLMTGFHKAEYGAWVGKPDEVDQFVCSDDLQ